MLKFLFKNKINVEISIKPYKLNLRNPFGTAHSVTTTRTNSLIEIKVENVRGFGECGLPPKKPLCYLADYNDIESYFKVWISEINEKNNKLEQQQQQQQQQPYYYDAFNKILNKEYFKDLRMVNSKHEQEEDIQQMVYQFLFECLDNCKENDKDYSNASRCAIEMALLDGWGKYLNKPIYKLTNIPDSDSCKPFYYTISMCPTMEEIMDSTDFGSKYTSFLKIKLDSDVEKGMNIIDSVIKHLSNKNKIVSKISVDANSSWNPNVAREYLKRLSPISNMISMVEQPFPIETLKSLPIDTDLLNEWISIKKEYSDNGLLIFADESVATEKDLPSLVQLVHGVNIKLEKAGGIRSGISTLLKAKELGLKTWIGSMVASSLNVSAAAHILTSLSDYGGDLDGGLLIDDETQLFKNDAFELIDNGLIKMNSDHYGIGVTLK